MGSSTPSGRRRAWLGFTFVFQKLHFRVCERTSTVCSRARFVGVFLRVAPKSAWKEPYPSCRPWIRCCLRLIWGVPFGLAMPRAPWIRKLIWRLPARLHPKVDPEIWVVAFDADSGEAIGGIRTKRPDFGVVTGVVEAAGKVWMSTIGFPAVAYFEL